jgi:hypothetical protein
MASDLAEEQPPANPSVPSSVPLEAPASAEMADAEINAFEAATENQAGATSDLEASAAASPPAAERRKRGRTLSPPEQETLSEGPTLSKTPGGNQATYDDPDLAISPPPAPTSPQVATSTEQPLASEATESTSASESIAAAPDAPSTPEATDRIDSDEPPPRGPLPREADGDIGTDQQTPAYAAVNAEAPLPVDEVQVLTTAERLELFLQTYCRAYSNKDLDRFAALFTFDAVERNRPFVDLIPVYRSNFEKLDEIDYEIDLQSYEETIDGSEILVKGGFRLSYRMGNNEWKSSNGRIEMTLVALDDEYRVKTLDYRKAP